VPAVPARDLALAALAALAVLVVELSLMRAFAQVTWPPFAYLGVSVAMFGGGASGTFLALSPRALSRRETPLVGAALIGIGAPLAVLLVLTLGLEPLLVFRALSATLFIGLALVVASLPFMGMGLLMSALLERHRAHAGIVYGADLVGAAAGVALGLPLIDAVGVAGAALVAGAVAATAGALGATGRASRALAVVLACTMAALVVPSARVLPVPTRDKKVGEHTAADVVARLSHAGRLVTRDRADARVDVIPASPAARLLFDFGAAVTRAPEARDLSTPQDDVTAAAFLARSAHEGRVLVVGAGAGYEVARALAFGASSVDAVEIASGVVDVVRTDAVPTARAVYDDPRVTLHHREARAFVEASDARYTHIVAIHTITNAALASGAMRLVEDFLLTTQSLTTLLSHLTDDGVLYLTRPFAQVPLLVDVARAALSEIGVPADDVDAHLVALTSSSDDPFYGGLLVFRDRAPVDVAIPRGAARAQLPARAATALPTDDRPFFHRLSGVVDDALDTRLRIEGPRLAERAVMWVALLATMLALVVVVLPMRVSMRRGERPSLALVGVALCLGVGFLLVELAAAQRLTLSLGTPLRAFAVVTGAMLVGAGLSSTFLARRLQSLVPALAASTAGALALALWPPVVDGLGPGAAPLVAFVVVAVSAAPMGLAFPVLVRSGAPGSAPWLFAMNAVASVLSSAVFALVAPAVGLFATGAIGVLAYVLALVLALIARPSSSQGLSMPPASG